MNGQKLLDTFSLQFQTKLRTSDLMLNSLYIYYIFLRTEQFVIWYNDKFVTLNSPSTSLKGLDFNDKKTYQTKNYLKNTWKLNMSLKCFKTKTEILTVM